MSGKPEATPPGEKLLICSMLATFGWECEETDSSEAVCYLCNRRIKLGILRSMMHGGIPLLNTTTKKYSEVEVKLANSLVIPQMSGFNIKGEHW